MLREEVVTDEVMRARWGEPEGDWTGWGWRNEVSCIVSNPNRILIWDCIVLEIL